MSNLLSCPFCGNTEPKLDYSPGLPDINPPCSRVNCAVCSTSGPFIRAEFDAEESATRSAAAQAWNKRATNRTWFARLIDSLKVWN